MVVTWWRVCRPTEARGSEGGIRTGQALRTTGWGGPPRALPLSAPPGLLLLCQDGSSSAEEIASEEEDCESMTLPTTEQAEEEMEEEAAMLEKYRQEREEMFPDEVDTPRDVPARVR